MPATLTDTDLPAAIRAIGALGELFDNGDTRAKEAALDAFQHGRQSYWSKGIYSNQRAGRLLWAANTFGLSIALRNVIDDTHPSHAAQTPYLLGTLIPLNREAMIALERAWCEVADTANHMRVAAE